MLNPIPLLEQLIAINSVNPSLVAHAPGEKDLALFVKSWCEAQNLEVSWLESRGRPSLIITTKHTPHHKTLMLNAHLDTVGVEGMDKPFTPRLEGKRLYGRGAVDMKAGLAACMVAIAEAQQQNLAKVILTAVADEEHASLGTAQVLEHIQADAAIVTEPTQLDIHVAHRGFAVFDIETLGRASHTSQPHLGINAISHMGYVLAEVEAVQKQLMDKSPHPFLGHGSLQPVRLRGGQELFTTPSNAILTLERRNLPGETKDRLEQEIKTLLDNAKRVQDFQASFKTVLHREPFEVSSESSIVKLLQTATQTKGLNSNIDGAPYWMDSALIAAKGIPTVIFGPSGGGMHAADEWVDIDSVMICAEVLLEIIKNLCR
jgi:acetylornithine deacetylase